jgi:signal transduction histidine kinase
MKSSAISALHPRSAPAAFSEQEPSAGLVDLVRAFKANTLITVDVQTADRADADLTTEQSVGLFHITQEVWRILLSMRGRATC